MPSIPEEKEYEFTPNTIGAISDTIYELSEQLAYNYFSNSFGDDYNNDIANCAKVFKNPAIFEERWTSRRRIRNILVVGAGACYDAYTAIPTGKKFIKSFKKRFKTDLAPFKKNFEEWEAKIKKGDDDQQLTFENYLSILTKILPEEKLRDEIKDLVAYRNSISLFNEIVAHMLKHSFLDVVVNYNFEETLDQTIRDEIGPDNYHHIITDEHCIGLDQIIVDGRLQSPIYIKPHGSYSQPSSLRFTDQHYLELPKAIRTMLEQLFNGYAGEDTHFERINLIIVGFACESAELNTIINTKLRKESVIYHIDFNPAKDGTTFFESKPYKTFLREAEKIHSHPNEIYKPISTANFNKGETKNNLTASLGELFTVLWRVQNDFFNQAYKPRSIARHEIISYLFYEPELGAKIKGEKPDGGRKFILRHIENAPNFFVDQLMVEFFVMLNRSNGMLDVVEVLKGRAGLYYQRYRDIMTKESLSRRREGPIHTIYEILHNFSSNETNQARALLTQADEFNRGANIFTVKSAFEEPDLSTARFKSKLAELIEQLGQSLYAMQIPDDSELSRVKIKALVDPFLHDVELYLNNWYSSISQRAIAQNKVALHELSKLGRAITLFFKLLQSECVTFYFKVNLLRNYNRKVYNGRNNVGKENDVMVNELFRLLEKSWGHHYFVIDPKPENPAHNFWESFSRKKVIHTNLARAAEFNGLLIDKEWDVFLTITETGSLLNFLRHLHDNLSDAKASETIAKIKRRHFVVICSYENIKQLYPESPVTNSKSGLIEKHRTHIRIPISATDCIIGEENVTLLVLPFNQHNHHSSTFLRARDESFDRIPSSTVLTTNNTKLKDEVTEGKFAYDVLRSIYFYRRGLSNSIDPIFIGLGPTEIDRPNHDRVFRDQVRLLDIFVKHLNRSFKFEMVKREGSTDFWPKPAWVIDLQKKWENGECGKRFKDITTTEFLSALFKHIQAQKAIF